MRVLRYCGYFKMGVIYGVSEQERAALEESYDPTHTGGFCQINDDNTMTITITIRKTITLAITTTKKSRINTTMIMIVIMIVIVVVVMIMIVIMIIQITPNVIATTCNVDGMILLNTNTHARTRARAQH